MPAQTTYELNPGALFLGQKCDSRDDLVTSKAAGEAMTPASIVVKTVGLDNTVRLPSATIATITHSSGTYTAGSYVILVGGTTVTVAYDTDKATTLAAVAVAIATLSTVASCTFTSGTGVLLITMKNLPAPVTADVTTSVTGTMTLASVVTCGDTFLGAALNPIAIEQTIAGVVSIAQYDAVSTLESGVVAVVTEQVTTTDSTVYVRFIANGAGKTIGQVRVDSDSGKAKLWSGARFLSSAAAGALVQLEIIK